MFVALNDESRAVRAAALNLVGRLSALNPAYVNPALRRHLLQLLADLEHSPDSKHRYGGPAIRSRSCRWQMKQAKGCWCYPRRCTRMYYQAHNLRHIGLHVVGCWSFRELLHALTTYV